MSEKFEKAKKGLACCERRGYCEGHCPYYEPEKEALECTSELAHDALALISYLDERIKELSLMQVARVMSLEELDAIYQIKERHTWPFNTPPYLWMTVNPDVRQTRGFWICWRDIMYSLENDSPFYVRENYGKVWKILTAEPTDEQRRNISWE